MLRRIVGHDHPPLGTASTLEGPNQPRGARPSRSVALQAGGRPFEPGTAHYIFGLQIRRIPSLDRMGMSPGTGEGTSRGQALSTDGQLRPRPLDSDDVEAKALLAKAGVPADLTFAARYEAPQLAHRPRARSRRAECLRRQRPPCPPAGTLPQVAVSKTVVGGFVHRGFGSHPLRCRSKFGSFAASFLA